MNDERNIYSYVFNDLYFEFIHTNDLHADIYVNGVNTQYYIPRHIRDTFMFSLENNPEPIKYLLGNFGNIWKHFELKYWDNFFNNLIKKKYPELLIY